MGIILYSNYSHETINIGGEFAMAFFILTIIISLLLVGTKLWSEYNSKTLDIISDPLLLILVMIILRMII